MSGGYLDDVFFTNRALLPQPKVFNTDFELCIKMLQPGGKYAEIFMPQDGALCFSVYFAK